MSTPQLSGAEGRWVPRGGRQGLCAAVSVQGMLPRGHPRGAGRGRAGRTTRGMQAVEYRAVTWCALCVRRTSRALAQEIPKLQEPAADDPRTAKEERACRIAPRCRPDPAGRQGDAPGRLGVGPPVPAGLACMKHVARGAEFQEVSEVARVQAAE